jgi:L-fuculose-phosphate aldolase
VNAVLHAHPKYILGFANLNLDLPIETKFARSLGFPLYIRCIKGQPSITKNEAIAITKYFKYLYNKNPNVALACLLPGHGIIVAGKSLEDSFEKLQILENNARTFYFIQLIKISDYYKEAVIRERDRTYDTWEDIQNTQIEEVEYYFEKKQNM